MVGSGGRGLEPDVSVPCRTQRSARRNWWEPSRSAGAVATNKSAVPGRRRVPRSLALRPSNPVPGTVPWITPRTGLAVHICPFGQDEMYGPGPYIHNGLIHELAGKGSDLIPKFADVVDELWILIGEVAADGPSARASRRHERSLGAAVRRLQPPLADGAVPATRAGEGPAERPLARPPPPRGGDRPADRPARGHGHPGPARSAGGGGHRAGRDDHHDPPRRIHGSRRLHDHRRHGPHAGDDARDRDDHRAG